MRLSRIILYSLFLFSACVTPFDVSNNFQEILVVEGMISDQPGPYLVKISKAIPIDQQLDKLVVVSNATVTIQDDQGNSEPLTEQTSGNYYTKFFQGIVGRSYSLKIITQEGAIYQSATEKLLPIGDFSNLRSEFRQNEPPLTNGQVTSTNGFNIYLDSEVLPEQEERVWWRWIGTYEIFTFPELRLKILATNPPREPPLLIPDPPPCSGYTIVNANRPSATKFGPLADCQCCTCWVSQYSDVPLISDPKFIANGKINNQYIGFIEANRRTFYSKYYIEVEQLSVSKAVYDFWKNVLTQKGNSSNLFQTPPPKTKGNISVVTANSTPVVGYFAASSIKKHAITLNRSDVETHYRLLPIDTIKESCVTAQKYSTTKKPIFW